MSKVLLVDDEARILLLLESLLRNAGFDTITAENGSNALEIMEREKDVDFVVTDLRMPGMDGMELFRALRRKDPGLPVILLTAYASVETAIEAMKGGIFDYITKPFKVDELMATIRAAERHANARKNENNASPTEIFSGFDKFVAVGDAMRDVCETMRKIAPSAVTVLINGESGTGKEVVARALHASSPRSSGPWVAVNCASLPEPMLDSELFGHMKDAYAGATSDKVGLIEAANGGTLFLDEISTLPIGLQSKLLRCMQEHAIRRIGGSKDIPVDVRVIAASNLPLEDAVQNGTFRKDLYYRLAVIALDLPPLRKRTDDILPLAQHFILSEMHPGRTPPSISNGAAEILTHYPWPGNVRELENAVRHALAFMQDGEVILPDHLPAKLAAGASASTLRKASKSSDAKRSDSADEIDILIGVAENSSLKSFLRKKEKEYLRYILSQTGGDKVEAARALKVSLATLYRKLTEDEGEDEEE